MNRVIEARGLRKTYGELVAVDGIDFAVDPGESFGLLGPNGAGKSTTMRMIGGTLDRTGGELCVAGLDPGREGPASVPTWGSCRNRTTWTKSCGWPRTSSCTAATSGCLVAT